MDFIGSKVVGVVEFDRGGNMANTLRSCDQLLSVVSRVKFISAIISENRSQLLDRERTKDIAAVIRVCVFLEKID